MINSGINLFGEICLVKTNGQHQFIKLGGFHTFQVPQLKLLLMQGLWGLEYFTNSWEMDKMWLITFIRSCWEPRTTLASMKRLSFFPSVLNTVSPLKNGTCYECGILFDWRKIIWFRTLSVWSKLLDIEDKAIYTHRQSEEVPILTLPKWWKEEGRYSANGHLESRFKLLIQKSCHPSF